MSFSDIIGQEIPKRILKSQLKSQRIGTGYLFYGPEGVGKTLTAMTFAKALNCETQKPCDVCQTCKDIENFRNPDFKFITSGEKKEIGINQIRDIKLRDSYRPAWLKFRIAIIREADTLTEEASNSFLKILEEPPPHTIFILTTSKINAILSTIRSRCQEIRFRRLTPMEIEKAVPDVSKSISQLANGSITRALKLLEPDAEKLRNSAVKFFNHSSIERMQLLENLAPFDETELLRSIQELYMDLLREKLGVSELIKNKDFVGAGSTCEHFEFKKDSPIEEILKATIVCERAFYALKRNVHKKLILYWLSKELP